jgi:hypothetical protein
MGAERRFRSGVEVGLGAATAAAFVALSAAAAFAVLHSHVLAALLAAGVALFNLALWPRRLPAVVVSGAGVEVRNYAGRRTYAWREVRDFALARKGPRRPLRIVLRLRDGQVRDLDALAQGMLRSAGCEGRLRRTVAELNDTARVQRRA